MSWTDTLITIIVLFGVFILAYASIRNKDMADILQEIKDLIKGKAEDAKEVIKYGWRKLNTLRT